MDLKTRERMKQLVESRETTSSKSEPAKIRGLGDALAKVTKAVGVQPCGRCEQRRQWLNRYFPVAK